MDQRLRDLLISGAESMGAVLDEEGIARFECYHRLLRTWGGKMNLTSRLEPGEIVVHHFLDSLAALPWVGGGEGARLLDIGTGAGFPGIPLKIVRVGLEVVLVDSVQKKISFCRQVIREAGLPAISAVSGRAEELSRDPSLAGSFDRVTSRAVAKAADLVSLSLPFLRPAGSILLYKGKPDRSELDPLEVLCARRGLAARTHQVAVPGLDAERTIIVVTRGAA